MSPVPIRLSAEGIDLKPRVFRSAAVAASPSGASETTIATVTVTGDLSTALGILVIGYCAFTVGTNGVSATLKIRQTDTSGTTVKTSGAVTAVAAELRDRCIAGVDTSPAAGSQVYVLTLTVGSGSAASTVSAVELVAIAI